MLLGNTANERIINNNAKRWPSAHRTTTVDLSTTVKIPSQVGETDHPNPLPRGLETVHYENLMENGQSPFLHTLVARLSIPGDVRLYFSPDGIVDIQGQIRVTPKGGLVSDFIADTARGLLYSTGVTVMCCLQNKRTHAVAEAVEAVFLGAAVVNNFVWVYICWKASLVEGMIPQDRVQPWEFGEFSNYFRIVAADPMTSAMQAALYYAFLKKAINEVTGTDKGLTLKGIEIQLAQLAAVPGKQQVVEKKRSDIQPTQPAAVKSEKKPLVTKEATDYRILQEKVAAYEADLDKKRKSIEMFTKENIKLKKESNYREKELAHVNKNIEQNKRSSK